MEKETPLQMEIRRLRERRDSLLNADRKFHGDAEEMDLLIERDSLRCTEMQTLTDIIAQKELVFALTQ